MSRITLLVALALPPLAASADGQGELERCAAGLDATLTVMEGAPLMKEEVATALMWLRLDAKRDLARGDAERCLARLAVVENILGVDREG